jgi:NAD(P)-dependent dehydrogenase (short-subunit alcohol dehydrogenase family)
VNNAAFQRTYEKFEDIPDDEFEEAYRVNVFAMFRLCKAILPQMKEGGSVINTASIQSFDPSPNLIAYASTKAAIVSFTRSLASFAIKQGVRVNAVAPGPVWTPLIPSTMPREKGETIRSEHPFRTRCPARRTRSNLHLSCQRSSHLCHWRSLRCDRGPDAALIVEADWAESWNRRLLNFFCLRIMS